MSDGVKLTPKHILLMLWMAALEKQSRSEFQMLLLAQVTMKNNKPRVLAVGPAESVN